METQNFSVFEIEQINRSLLVLQMLQSNPKMTQKMACDNVGIDPKTYRKWIATQESALVSFEDARKEIERNEFASLLIVKNAVVDRLVVDAMKPDLSIPDRLRALQHIDQRIDELSERYHTVDVEAEQDLLSGPNTKLGTNRLANRVRISEDRDVTTIVIKDKPPIIDIQP